MNLVQADPVEDVARDLLAQCCDAAAAAEPSFIARNFYEGSATHAREEHSKPPNATEEN